MSGPPGRHTPSMRASTSGRSSIVAGSGGSTTGWPPARTMASRYVRPTAIAGTRQVCACSVLREVIPISGRTARRVSSAPG
jgi:hypothetical protein